MLTSDTLAALLRTICSYPHDLDARLVMADALEESGDGERAEFIRLQIELSRMGRAPSGTTVALNRSPAQEWMERRAS